MMKLIPVQVNDADYGDSRSRIEAKSYFDRKAGELDWAVPAWEEMGLGELAGEFPTREAAEAVLRDHAVILREYGYEACFPVTPRAD